MTWLDSEGRGQILWTPYLMNYLSNLNAAYLSLASTDDLVRFWRSRSQQAVKLAKAITSTLGRQSPSSHFVQYNVLLWELAIIIDLQCLSRSLSKLDSWLQQAELVVTWLIVVLVRASLLCLEFLMSSLAHRQLLSCGCFSIKQADHLSGNREVSGNFTSFWKLSRELMEKNSGRGKLIIASFKRGLLQWLVYCCGPCDACFWDFVVY